MELPAELQTIAARLEEREHRERELLAPTNLALLVEKLGEDGVLLERKNAHGALSAGYFQAGVFDRAAFSFRRQHDNLTEYIAWCRENGDDEGARLLREERARIAWGPGELELFEDYVEEGADPERDATPRFEAWPALFLAWATLKRRVHGEHWLGRWADAVSDERRRVRGEHPDSPDAAEAVLIDARVARAAWWLGDFAKAARHAARAAAALRRWSRDKPQGLQVPEKRVRLLRSEGIVLLADGRRHAEHLDSAIDSLAKALEASYVTRSIDWKDLVLLHLTARAWRAEERDESDALVESFERHFPHLTHLLARERQWVE